MADWQEAVQSIIIGFVFAYMLTKLFSLISSFRDENLRVERVQGTGAPLLSTSEDQGLAPADERNVPLVSLEEEMEADGEDERDDHAHESSSSDSDSEVEGTLVTDSRTLHGIDDAAVLKVPEKEEEQHTEVIEDIGADVVKVESDDRVIPLGEHSLKALTEDAGEDATKEIEEGNETDDWEGVERTELEELFGAASMYVASMVTLPGVKPSSEAMLQLYAFYKIATEGPCSTSQPSAFQPTARAKWNAWHKLGNLPQEEAMQNYVAVLTGINPTWHKNYQKSEDPAKEAAGQSGENSSQPTGRMGPGPVFSSLAMSEEGGEDAGSLEPIHACASQGDLVGLSHLLDGGSQIDLKDSDGRTPLIWAADRGQLSAVEILVAKGAEIHAKDLEGQTALHYATTCEQEAVAKYLVEHGADVNIADNDGITPLELCPPHWLWLRGTEA